MPKRHRYPQNLRELALFADCTDDELDLIGGLITPVTLPEGTVLLHQDATDRQFLVLAEGQARVVRWSDDSANELALLGPGDFVGEMALLDRQPRNATVVAVTPVRAYVSTLREFNGLLAVAPSVRAKILAAADARRSVLQTAA